MYLLLITICLILLLLKRIHSIISEQNRQKPRIGDKIIAKKYKLNKIEINFGSKLYRKLNEENVFDFVPNLYSNSPKNGINYSVEYLDTKATETLAEDSPQKPVFVLLHGSPGSVEDFELFVGEFGEKYRLIIPQLPDFSFTRKTEQFWHSNEERVEYLLSFLTALGVKEVDCLICHSGGNPMALQIISDEKDSNIVIKSMVMITAPGINWLNTYQLKNSRKWVRLGSNFWTRYMFLVLWPDWLSILVGVPETLVRNTSKDDLFWMTFVVALSQFEVNIKERYECLAQKQIPTLYVMAERDGLFPKYKYFKTLDSIGCNEEKYFTHIGSEGNVESKAETKGWFRVLNFRFGGHFCFKKYSEVFHNEFIEFFESLKF